MAAIARTETRVRYAETDQMGVVYHANYVIYFEVGRTDFMRQHGMLYTEMEQAGMILAVVEMSARFKRSARYDEVLAVETRLAAASGVQVRFEYRVLRSRDDGAEEELCTGFTVLACVNRAGRPTRFQSPWKERILALAGAGSGAAG